MSFVRMMAERDDNWVLVDVYADVDAPYGQNTKRP